MDRVTPQEVYEAVQRCEETTSQEWGFLPEEQRRLFMRVAVHINKRTRVLQDFTPEELVLLRQSVEQKIGMYDNLIKALEKQSKSTEKLKAQRQALCDLHRRIVEFEEN